MPKNPKRQLKTTATAKGKAPKKLDKPEPKPKDQEIDSGNSDSDFGDDEMNMGILDNMDKDKDYQFQPNSNMFDLDQNSEPESDDDAENDDSDDVQNETPSLSNGKSKKKKKSHNSNPSINGTKMKPKEIKQLQETEILYQSNLYRFQIQELLKEVTIQSKVKIKIQKWFTEFKKTVESIQPSPQYQIVNFHEWIEDIKLPLPVHLHPTPETKGTFRWIKPTQITPIGSWDNQTSVAKLSYFDIALELPSELLVKRDFLNHGYHIKRAMYLTYLALNLKDKEDEIKFIYQEGDPMKPIVQIKIKQKSQLCVRIHCAPPPDWCKPSRLRPSGSNLRPAYLNIPWAEKIQGPEPPTPNYNSTILSDILLIDTHSYLKKTLGNNGNICEAIKLLKIWLHQRGLNQGWGSFSSTLLTAFIAYLTQANKINNMMSSYQVVRIVFVNLSQLDWTTKGISFIPGASLVDWHQHYDVVFLDPSNQLNLASNMTKFTYKRIQHECKNSLEILNKSSVGGFQALFITKTQFIMNFDHILELKVNPEMIFNLMSKKQFSKFFVNYSFDPYPIVMSVVGELVEKCFINRVKLIDVELRSLPECNITQNLETKQEELLRFGFVINRETAFKLIEKAESEDKVIADSFKTFWGDKCKLRRFMDGSMLESVSFEDCEGANPRIMFHMLKYILGYHTGMTISDEDYLDKQIEVLTEAKFSVMKRKIKEKKKDYNRKNQKKMKFDVDVSPVSLEEITTQASKSFDGLSKILRQLEGLPLEITSIQGTSSILRFTNIFPNPPQKFFKSTLLTEEYEGCLKLLDSESGIPKVPKHVEPIGVMIQLEASGKWPDDVKAIERLKCAFLLRIGSLLKEQFGLSVQTYPRHLFVLKDGFVFQVKLTYYRELILLKQLRGTDGVLKSRDNTITKNIERETLHRPILTSTLNAFHRINGAFGGTCRVAKRWISSQLLLGSSKDYDSEIVDPETRFTEESIELIVASLFLDSASYISQPHESQVGFLRFVNVVATTDWRTTPLILNFNEKFSSTQITDLESEFTKRRDQYPSLCIITPDDLTGSVWSKHISELILSRASILANQALKTLFANENSISAFDISRFDFVDRTHIIFKPTTKIYDIVIWIKMSYVPRKSQAHGYNEEGLKFSEYVKSQNEVMPIIDFDPVDKYFRDLKETLGHLMIFFNDPYGCQFIGGIWKPDVFNPTEFKVSAAKNKILQSSGHLALNPTGVIEEIELLGNGIIDKVEQNTTIG